jgi:TolB-like protein/Flp pilus assembly protein TadD
MRLWQDLRRRRIFRLVGIYVVGAWIVIQVADIFFPAWGIPDTAMRFLFIAAALCFPIALVFGWIFDITSAGIVRTREAGSDESIEMKLQRQDYVILAALLAVGIAVLLGSAEKIYEEIEESPIVTAVMRFENSIAILPFTNLDINADTGFFSDGVTEEILHRLSSLGALHVLASNSSFALRDSQEGPARISEILGVRYLLRGSVRRDKDYVRVTANLLDESGYTVWTQTFDRKLESIFTIQSEIASTVSSEVLNEIVPLKDLPAGRTTKNMDAYDAYLAGRAYVNARTADWQDHAEVAFRRAIELDAGFAPAYAGLAISLYVSRGDLVMVDDATDAAKRSLELDPELALGHAILGLITFEQTPDLAEAIRLLQRAIELDSSLGHAYNWLAILFFDQGMTAGKEAIQDRGLEIDPFNAPLSVNVANRESRKGNFGRAEQLMLRVAQLPEPPGVALFEIGSLYMEWGRLDKANYWTKEIVRAYAQTPNTIGFAALAWSYERLGLSSDADYWINVFLQQTPNGPGHFLITSYLMRLRGDIAGQKQLLAQFEQTPGFDYSGLPPFIAVIYGAANLVARDYETGIKVLESMLDISFSGFTEHMEDSDAIDLLHTLAYAYEQVGQSDKSHQLLLELAEVIDTPKSRPLLLPPDIEGRALNRAMLGDSQGALDALQKAVELGWTNYYWLTNDPAWSKMRELPEFQELLGEVKVELDRQRAIVEAADAEHDFRAEIEQLLTP